MTMTNTGDEKGGSPDVERAGDSVAVTAVADDTTPASDTVGPGPEETGGDGPRRRRPGRKDPLAFGAGVLVGAVVVALVAIFIWPGHLFGPGSPDSVASQSVAALVAKDRAAIDRLSCRGPGGAPVVSGDILNVISGAKPAGPATAVIDTEAHAPVDLTVSFQGQTQALPINLVLGVSDGNWCFKSISQR
jgi:hypothetical protein